MVKFATSFLKEKTPLKLEKTVPVYFIQMIVCANVALFTRLALS
jgi:hypothetical protein